MEKARNQKLDPVIGRDMEIRNIIRILSRKTKNNPVLIGEPGVGKTAAIEGLDTAYCGRGCTGRPEEQEDFCPGYGSTGCRCQVSW